MTIIAAKRKSSSGHNNEDETEAGNVELEKSKGNGDEPELNNTIDFTVIQP